MTLRKMSTKVLSVFLAMIMIVALWAPAVSAAGHDHAHKVEINYDETQVRDALNALIGQLLGDEAFYADYTVNEDSYYVAIGDDIAYATVLAGKLGLGEDQFEIMDEAGQVVWYSHLFQNFPHFLVIHTVKVFGIVNKAEIDVFLKLSEQDKCPPNQTKEAGIGNIPDKEFQIMIVKMIQNLEIGVIDK